MKYIFTSSTIAIMAVVVLLTTGTGVTNFITPAYAPEPARLDEPTLSGWRCTQRNQQECRNDDSANGKL